METQRRNLDTVSLTEVMEILSDCRTAPLHIPAPADDLPGFASRYLTASQALTVQMRHYTLSMSTPDPRPQVAALVEHFRNENIKRGFCNG